VQVEIAAPRAVVWEVLTEVAHWPGRIASITSVELLGATTLGPGVGVRIRQPKLPLMVWRVVQWRPGESFTWLTASPGVRTLGTHAVTPAGEGSTLLLGVYHHGPLAPLVRLLTGRLTRRYLELEAAGHKAAAESARRGPARDA